MTLSLITQFIMFNDALTSEIIEYHNYKINGQAIYLKNTILNDSETIKEGFRIAIVNFKDEVLKMIDEDPLNYSKCVKSFTKQLKTVSTWNHSLFQKALFSFIDDKTMTP